MRPLHDALYRLLNLWQTIKVIVASKKIKIMVGDREEQFFANAQNTQCRISPPFPIEQTVARS
jgi:hypothetical protein